MRIALYQPDIPQNTGTIVRLGACLGIAVDIIEPAGFAATEPAFRRAGLDYVPHAAIRRHRSFAAFDAWRQANGSARLILLSTKAAIPYFDMQFRPDDILLFGRESAGVPECVHDLADARVLIPMRPGLRSLNIAMAVALVTGEALRQTGGYESDKFAAFTPGFDDFADRH